MEQLISYFYLFFKNMNKNLRVLFFVCIFFLMAIGLTELFFRAAVKFEELPENVLNGNAYKFDSGLYFLNWSDGLKAHPFLGYTEDGQDEYFHSVKYKARDANSFNVLLVGGSVALNFWHFAKDNFADKLKKQIPELAKKKINIINMAIGGGKQPRQFFGIAYMIDSVDLVINIDGFNEMDSTFVRAYYPLEYPSFGLKYFTDEFGTLPYLWLFQFFRGFYRLMSIPPIQSTFFSSSYSYFAVWKFMSPRLYGACKTLENLYAESVVKKRTKLFSDAEDDSVIQEYANLWKKYVELSYVLARARGVKFFSFVQPNQYLIGSKSFSKEEMKIAYNQKFSSIENKKMVTLNEAAQSMIKNGLPVYDLMHIFKNNDQTIYSDSCCHINDLGNQILEENILSVLKKDFHRHLPVAH